MIPSSRALGAALALLGLAAVASAVPQPGQTYTASDAWAYRDEIKAIDVTRYASVASEQERIELAKLIGECDTTLGFLGSACRKAGDLRDALDKRLQAQGAAAADQECAQPMDADAARDDAYVAARKKRCAALDQKKLEQEIADKKLDPQKCDAYSMGASPDEKDYDHMIDLCRQVYLRSGQDRKKAELLTLEKPCQDGLRQQPGATRDQVAACRAYDKLAAIPTQEEQAAQERQRLEQQTHVQQALQDADAFKQDQQKKWGFVPQEDTLRIQADMGRHIASDKQDALRGVFKYNPAAAERFASQAEACDALPAPKQAKCNAALQKRYEAFAAGRPLGGRYQGEDRAYFAYACQKLPAAAASGDDPDAGLRAKCAAYTKRARGPSRRRIAASIPSPAVAPAKAVAAPPAQDWLQQLVGWIGSAPQAAASAEAGLPQHGCYLKGMTPPTACAAGSTNCVCE